MKAEEIRIGNLIAEPYDNSPETVDKIVNYKDGEAEINEEIISYFNPIPLTEEWLLKFGFEKGRKYYSFNGFDVDDKGWIGFNNMVADCKVQYVHQLQNLYFALIGEELKII